LTTSARSELSLCKDCLRACECCGAEVAPEELDAETKRCPECKDAEDDEEMPQDVKLIPSRSS
jgi:hypothetical protein